MIIYCVNWNVIFVYENYSSYEMWMVNIKWEKALEQKQKLIFVPYVFDFEQIK